MGCFPSKKVTSLQRSSNGGRVRNGFRFENVVNKVLLSHSFILIENENQIKKRLNKSFNGVDFLAESDKNILLIQCKYKKEGSKQSESTQFKDCVDRIIFTFPKEKKEKKIYPIWISLIPPKPYAIETLKSINTTIISSTGENLSKKEISLLVIQRFNQFLCENVSPQTKSEDSKLMKECENDFDSFEKV